MYNTAHFSRMPRSKLPGTRMKKPQIAAGTSLHGKIVPLFCNLVMPGQIDSCIANGSIWMSSPIAPIMSQIKGSINVFFIPLRLVWDHTKQFFGENDTTYGPQTTQYKIPSMRFNTGDSHSDVGVGTVSHYLHKPLYRGSGHGWDSGMSASILKERAFWLTYFEYYRHEQVMNPVLLDKSDNAVIGSLNGYYLEPSDDCPNCLKDFDYFTTATVSPNYGGEVLLPLGSTAPVFAGLTDHLSNGQQGVATLKWYSVSSGGVGTSQSSVGNIFNAAAGGTKLEENWTTANTSHYITPSNLYADLSNATAAKIDDLYTAMAAQAWYHNANYGSRYFSMLEIHYGVSNPDLVLQRPEHIAEFKFDIQVQDVISTAGAANDSSTKLGQPGAVSKTYINRKLYNHSFGEWGFVLALFNTYHQRYYSGGVPREDLYEDMFDFYFPEFANRGDDVLYEAELMVGDSTKKDTGFGFQEAYADRRYYPATVTGQLDPYAGSSAIGRFVLAESWSTPPTLSASFLEENRDAIKDALVSGNNGPDYIWQFNFEHTEILPMPAYSKPGVPSFGRGII